MGVPIEFPLNPVIAQEFTDANGIIWYCEQDEDSLGVGTGPIWARKAIEKVSTDGSLPMVGQLLLIDQNASTGNPPTDPKHAVSKEYADNNPNGISAINPLRQTMIGELELPDAILSAIDEQINANSVVDVFIYDTSTDDDGGFWNKSGFTGLSILVLEAGLLSLYDANGDMLAPFKTITTAGATSVTAKHGMIGIGTGTGFKTYDIELNYLVEDWTSKIVNTAVNDVAATYQNGVIWAVATDGGVSVIHPDGSVADSGSVDIHAGVEIIGSDLWTMRGQSTHIARITYNIFGLVNGFGVDRQYSRLSTPALLDSNVPFKSANTAIGGQLGLQFIRDDKTAEVDSMVAYQTADYTSGFLHGDIKGAWLASTDDTDLTVGQTDPDRSINNIPLNTVGTITKTEVASGAELVGYSGFSGANYLEQPYNEAINNIGTGDFHVAIWFKSATTSTRKFIVNRTQNPASGNELRIRLSITGTIEIAVGSTVTVFSSPSEYDNDSWHLLVLARTGSNLVLYIDGYEVNSNTNTGSFDNVGAVLRVGTYINGDEAFDAGDLNLLRLGAGAPTAQDIARIYKEELPLFQENAKCTLGGASSDVKSLDFDKSNNLLTVCTATSVSKFNGLIRTETEDKVVTSISTVSGKEVLGS